jgi:hypothetical protein
MNSHVEFALAHPVFDPGTQIVPGHFWLAANAQAFAERLRPVLSELVGLSANAAAELDRRGYATARGGRWSARAVISARARLDGQPESS